MHASPFLVAALVLLAGAAVAVWDLSAARARTVVVYTTPALRDVVEEDVAPRFQEETGYEVKPVYLAAGQQYNRLRMSRGHQEAHVFLHASPLFLEKGARDGFFAPYHVRQDPAIADGFKGAAAPGGRVWYAFAWSPLVEVYAPTLPGPPDLADSTLPFGFPHPSLSNNGVYAALFFEEVSPEAGAQAVRVTRVQPVNARTNIAGVADRSFQVTLGYEAVTLFYRDQGAEVAYDLPVVAGERVTTPVLCSVGIVEGTTHPGAEQLVRFLFTNETQSRLGKYHFRPVTSGTATAAGLLDTAQARTLHYDWDRWAELEEALPKYLVSS